jgi:hypothetical protein
MREKTHRCLSDPNTFCTFQVAVDGLVGSCTWGHQREAQPPSRSNRQRDEEGELAMHHTPAGEKGEHVESGDHVTGHGVLDVGPHGGDAGARGGAGGEAVQQHLRELHAGQSDAVLVDAGHHIRAPDQRRLVLRPRRLRHLQHRLP